MPSKQKGISLIEILIAAVIAGLLIKALTDVVNTALDTGQSAHQQNGTLQQARFAMERMTRAASRSRELRIPLAENATTAWSESVRNVLAVTLDPTLDRNKDGWADANNDKDFLDANKSGTRDAGEPERIDEDFNLDSNSDNKPGIINIDDNGDGNIDVGNGFIDNDEDNSANEDAVNGLDDDNDGAIDEDPPMDMNGDGKAGIVSVDDDFDGSIDEGNNGDDDEDGLVNEDWADDHVFFLNGTALMERLPDIGATDGADYTEYPIAENVSQLRVERLLGANGSTVLVDLTLTLSPPGSVPVILNTRVGVGSGL